MLRLNNLLKDMKVPVKTVESAPLPLNSNPSETNSILFCNSVVLCI